MLIKKMQSEPAKKTHNFRKKIYKLIALSENECTELHRLKLKHKLIAWFLATITKTMHEKY